MVAKNKSQKGVSTKAEPTSDFPTFLSPATQPTNEEPKRKRGRKPKGGKIISQEDITTPVDVDVAPNVVLHLKCHIKDLLSSRIEGNTQTNANQSVEGYSAYIAKTGDLEYQIISNPAQAYEDNNDSADCLVDSNNHIISKLEELSRCLHSNDISDKKSDCFWCTCEFDNPHLSIPKYEFNGVYHVYGCFCSPECAAAYLMEQRIDTSTKDERYALLNHLYCKIYDYKRNILPAPNPHYTLDKYYGNLTIQEYRQLLKSERLLLIVDKPLTRVLPELHQDTGEHALGLGGLGMTSSTSTTSKFRLKRKTSQPNKRTVVNHTFGITG